MPAPQIDLGDGLNAEIYRGQITLLEDTSRDLIVLTFAQFDKLVAFVAAHREGK